MPTPTQSPTGGAEGTPLPWSVSSSTIIIGSGSKDLPIICNTLDLMGVSEIGITEARANAALIVEAVNSHAATQQAIAGLGALVTQLRDIADQANRDSGFVRLPDAHELAAYPKL